MPKALGYDFTNVVNLRVKCEKRCVLSCPDLCRASKAAKALRALQGGNVYRRVWESLYTSAPTPAFFDQKIKIRIDDKSLYPLPSTLYSLLSTLYPLPNVDRDFVHYPNIPSSQTFSTRLRKKIRVYTLRHQTSP